MKPIWLIQTDMDGVDTKPMIREATRQGMPVDRVTKHPLTQQVDLCYYRSTDCAVCYGDIDFVRQVKHRTKVIPGAWCNFDNMRCSTYYAYFGEHLLNKDYTMLPLGDLLRRWDHLTIIGACYPPIYRSLFIRPDSGAKPFTGYVVEPDGRSKIQSLVETVGPDMLVVVAPKKEIEAEWRFVVCDGKVVTGCQYLPIEKQGYPPSSLCLANKIASHEWQPDRCYTIDIAESEGAVYLLEINSFSCAGFYDCDIESIVQCVSKAAVDEWKEYC